jgi:predicted secreted Zn-dependent protease
VTFPSPQVTRTTILAVLSVAALTSAQDAFQLRTNYYNISGVTEAELRRSINQSRPWKDKDPTDARTDWKIQWTFTTEAAGEIRRLRSLEIKTTVTYTLPRWTPGPDAPQTVREHWAKYSAALKTHEDGHARIALAAAREIRKRVNALTGERSADRLDREINHAANKAVAEYRELEVAFDKKTVHGASQGAHFP